MPPKNTLGVKALRANSTNENTLRVKKSRVHTKKSRPRPQPIPCPDGCVMIWGKHGVAAVLANPKRRIHAMYLTAQSRDWFAGIAPKTATPEPIIVDRAYLDSTLPDGEKTVHQNVVVVASMLEQPVLGDFLATALAPLAKRVVVILLDQITDGRNIGAILRSAAAFGAMAVITTDRHSPSESAIMLRAASGAFEQIPLIRVVNLARTMGVLAEHGFTLAGMTAGGEHSIETLAGADRLGIIMGAEGKGLRRLTAEKADMLVRIPIDKNSASLNVSVATAIALFAANQR